MWPAIRVNRKRREANKVNQNDVQVQTGVPKSDKATQTVADDKATQTVADDIKPLKQRKRTCDVIIID